MNKAPYEMLEAEYLAYVINLDWKSDEWQTLINWNSGENVKYGTHIEVYRRQVVIPQAQAAGHTIPDDVLKELEL